MQEIVIGRCQRHHLRKPQPDLRRQRLHGEVHLQQQRPLRSVAHHRLVQKKLATRSPRVIVRYVVQGGGRIED